MVADVPPPIGPEIVWTRNTEAEMEMGQWVVGHCQ